MIQPSTTMIKILIFRNYSVLNEPHFLKKLRRNLRIFLLINVWWVNIYCNFKLTICLTCTRVITERQRKVNIQHEDRLSCVFRVFIHVRQYPISHKKPDIYIYISTWSYENRVSKHLAIFLNFPSLIACLLCCLLMSFVLFLLVLWLGICVEVNVDRITILPPPPYFFLPTILCLT